MSDLSAALMYGYALGGGEGEWLLEEVQPDRAGYGKFLHLDWWNPLPDGMDIGGDGYYDRPRPAEDFITAAKRRLYNAIPGIEPVEAGSYFNESEIKFFYGVEFCHHGSEGYLEQTLAVEKIEVEWGLHQVVPLATMTNPETNKARDANLAHALEVLGVHPTQKQPAWLLTATYF